MIEVTDAMVRDVYHPEWDRYFDAIHKKATSCDGAGEAGADRAAFFYDTEADIDDGDDDDGHLSVASVRAADMASVVDDIVLDLAQLGTPDADTTVAMLRAYAKGIRAY